MALVNYSDTDGSSANSESEEILEYRSNAAKKLKLDKQRLPLPKAISDMKNSASKYDKPVENFEDHEGRLRSFEHERGNWATYAYIPVNLLIIEEIQNVFMDTLKSVTVTLKLCKDIHISLTKTIILRHHWIDSFITSIRENLDAENEFLIGFTTVSIYCNEERSRTFIGLTIDSAYCTQLKSATHTLNNILHDFNLEKFYEEPSFHASIIWCLGDQREILLETLPKLQEILNNYHKNEEKKELELKVSTICCKIGNKLFIFNLRKR